ncbi:MAG TPA: hypothetical protein VMU08_12610 [Rhizomicrobium sp.]|nr:hypothetical protein [Rhizomicrobium sp.]
MTARHLTAAILVLGLAAPVAAQEENQRTPEACGTASLCTANTSLDMHRKGWRVRGLGPGRPVRYACDQSGFNCHYTRDYFISDDGNAQYAPGGGRPVGE